MEYFDHGKPDSLTDNTAVPISLDKKIENRTETRSRKREHSDSPIKDAETRERETAPIKVILTG